MKKSLSAILVILISLVGLKGFAAQMDQNIKKSIKETKDIAGDRNDGARRCGSKVRQ